MGRDGAYGLGQSFSSHLYMRQRSIGAIIYFSNPSPNAKRQADEGARRPAKQADGHKNTTIPQPCIFNSTDRPHRLLLRPLQSAKMKHHLLITSILLTLLSPSLSTDIIFPLYLYPGADLSAWSAVTSAIEAHPSVQWQIIINPQSGPGTTGPPTDPGHIAGITKMNSYPNVQTVGYVLTGHGSRDMSLVTADVDTYASWTGPLALKGIYFDEVSAETTQTMYNFYETAAKHARERIPSAHVSFNPGTIAPNQYFSYCDTMVMFEASWADYQAQKPIAKIEEQYREKTAFQVYSTPEGTDVDAPVQEMAGEGIGMVYFGMDCCYKEYSAALIGKMADSAQAGGTCDEL